MSSLPVQISIVALILLSGLLARNTSPAKNGGGESDSRIDTIRFEDFQRKTFDFCEPLDMEVVGIYPILDSLPAITEDTLTLDNYLKAQGFTVIDGGWGNWMEGPRIVELTLQKETCRCSVSKKYRLYEMGAGGVYTLSVTERLVCDQPAIEGE